MSYTRPGIWTWTPFGQTCSRRMTYSISVSTSLKRSSTGWNHSHECDGACGNLRLLWHPSSATRSMAVQLASARRLQLRSSNDRHLLRRDGVREETRRAIGDDDRVLDVKAAERGIAVGRLD